MKSRQQQQQQQQRRGGLTGAHVTGPHPLAAVGELNIPTEVEENQREPREERSTL